MLLQQRLTSTKAWNQRTKTTLILFAKEVYGPFL